MQLPELVGRRLSQRTLDQRSPLETSLWVLRHSSATVSQDSRFLTARHNNKGTHPIG
ncbi:hypothetical protein BN2476_310110 [Paraburkholderia piptadeniae]|uniref:Uncharacterized protein n=1 Tax=Paraburkholderia piptadeniae TaxID=1701573 RepID=A0A1N7S4E5_9BURK|nr:hypothetical protein BN2476_310110 [Paraburkholderia piptadeniae]